MKKTLLQQFTTIILITISITCFSQEPTIGLLQYDETATEGYTLFTPESNNSVYLINNCGEVINSWDFTEKPGLTCYILQNGNLLRAGKNYIEIRAWNNNLLWSYSVSELGLNQHHDIEPLPNGNILCIVGDNYSTNDIIAQGKNPSLVGANHKLDKIIEIQPIGTNSVNVVWEWKFIDHLIQDYDASKPNYGVVADHPELIDLNYIDPNISNQSVDYIHLNGIDYNSELDQILISSRNLNEIFIIDHSTTTLEASEHTGGNSNMGGDILWRWGNPRVYKQGNEMDQKLFVQHDAKWVESGYLDEGKISVFNNGGDGTSTYSSVHLLNPEFINDSYTKENSKFKPLDYDWSWNGEILNNMLLETKKSGAHSLPNGNFIITETSLGQVSEVTKSGNVLWTYRNPTGPNSNVFNQFEDATAGNNCFRFEKYPVNFIGFSGKDMSPQSILENQNSISDSCSNSLSLSDLDINKLSVINPVKSNTIVFSNHLKADSISIINTEGKTVFFRKNYSGKFLNVDLNNSIYFIKFSLKNKTVYKKIIVSK
jgi:hypothetical protein